LLRPKYEPRRVDEGRCFGRPLLFLDFRVQAKRDRQHDVHRQVAQKGLRVDFGAGRRGGTQPLHQPPRRRVHGGRVAGQGVGVEHGEPRVLEA
jgi:hypothetical protein